MKLSRSFILIIAMVAILAIAALGDAHPLSARLQDSLLQGIEACFAGDYDAAWNRFDQIETLDAVHPAREFYLSTVLFWRNNVDHNNPRYDGQIRELLRQCLSKSQAMLEKDPDNIEALHYAGLAYTYLGRMDAHRGDFYEGGVKGENGRQYLEKALAECERRQRQPNQEACDLCEEVYFPLGAYTYFSGRLPRFLRLFDFLWFIPKGSTDEGLEMLSRALEKGCLHRLGAQSLLTSIYATFEQDKIEQARVLSSDLIRRFPDNPYLDLEHARILLNNGRIQAARQHADGILKKVSAGKRNYDDVVELGARLIMVEAELNQKDIRTASNRLAQIQNNPAYQNNTLTGRIFLLEGQIADLQGRRRAAEAAYQKVVDAEAHRVDRTTKKKAELYLESPFNGPQA